MIHSTINFLNNGIVRKTATCTYAYTMEFMHSLINHFIDHPDPMVVPIFNFKKVKKLVYTYDMVKLDPLSPMEEDLVDKVGDETFNYGDRTCSILEMKHPGVRNTFPVLFPFLEQVVSDGRYWDIHSGNIMKRNINNYAVIDLEGFLNEPLNDPSNDWIIRTSE